MLLLLLFFEVNVAVWSIEQCLNCSRRVQQYLKWDPNFFVRDCRPRCRTVLFHSDMKLFDLLNFICDQADNS
jgi:hypothetical protein